jgi:homoserine dehydrogenase
VFSDHGVSVETVEQSVNRAKPGAAPTASLMVVTHEATDAALSLVVSSLAASDAVESITSVIRVEGL